MSRDIPSYSNPESEMTLTDTSFLVNSNNSGFQTVYLYNKIYKKTPQSFCSSYLNDVNVHKTKKQILKLMEELVEGDLEHFILRIYDNDENHGSTRYEHVYFNRNVECLLYMIENSCDDHVHYSLLYNHNLDSKVEVLFNKTRKIKRLPISYKNNFHVVLMNGNKFNLEKLEYAPKKTIAAFEDLYNEDFYKVSDHILKRLQTERDKGIVLLHGTYGSGKTSYLRHLIKTLEKKIIYFPPDLTRELANPNFLAFIRNHTDCILIIEDAENILAKREGGGNQAISNLLNISDGILGDALNIQLVCTFNCAVDEIDPALLRPGRLIAKYHFTELSPDRTNALITKLYGDTVKATKPKMTIAEIFSLDEERFCEEEKKIKIGFY